MSRRSSVAGVGKYPTTAEGGRGINILAFVAAVVILCAAGTCMAGTIYVDADAPGANNGTSWTDAYRHLQNGLGAAGSGTVIRVAQGTYKPDTSTANPAGSRNRAATFGLKGGVTIMGGYAGYGAADPDARNISGFETILSGDLAGNDGVNFANNAENSYHVVTANSAGVLDGVTIAAGNANGSMTAGSGGGLYAYTITPTLKNCTFRKNSAASGGGGAYSYGYGVVATFINCRFIGNQSGIGGGGIKCNRSSPTITNCVFIGNHAGGGGGLHCIQGTSKPTVTNCTFFGNTASLGGGIRVQGGAVLALRNSILWGNSDNGGTDESAQIEATSVSATISYSCIQGWTGGLGGTGNTGNDPVFVDADGPDNTAGTDDDNVQLNYGSPCIDSANNASVPTGIITDIAGNARFFDDIATPDTGVGTPPIVDRGAFEYCNPVIKLDVQPDRLDFWMMYGDSDPNSQFVQVSNSGGGTLNWHINEDCPWLDTIPSSGSCTTEIDEAAIAINSSGLEPGRYECELTVVGENCLDSPQTVRVSLHITEIPQSDYWRDYIDFPGDPFKSEVISENDPGWVKFTMILASPYNRETAYFQDSKQYRFHYEFATEHLTPFIGMTSSQYEQVTMHAPGQQAALGAVIMPADMSVKEYGIQFIRYDAYTREEIVSMFNAVKASITAAPDVQAFYFPTYEQMAVADSNSAWFEAQGIPVSSTARWAKGNACYSAGWALGTLKYFPPEQIVAAYQNGSLLPDDILLTDGVPAELPYVAGILSLLPSTPSSHVAMLAQTFGIPFGHLAIAADAMRAQGLVGKTVMVCVGQENGVVSIGMKDMTGLLTPQETAEILALKIPKPVAIKVMEPYGSYSANTAGLGPEDIRFFGGKAANFGMLRRAVPDHCPVAVAISFDLWNEFLSQTLAGGRTLREEINSRLSAYTYPPADLPALYADLKYIREDLFTNTSATTFTQHQMDAIISILQDPNYGFDAVRNIRFRSSTNVEDSNQFSGAGLYDSYSGCLADELDGDTKGPCICNPSESKERGVFRAIRKVYASFYNDNAYLERLRHNIDANDVGMALLVHHSSPDQFELANGVATLEKRQSDAKRYIKLVTQKGATSVANPDDGSLPEEVSAVYVPDANMQMTLVRSSNLVILGETVMDWPADYNQVSSLLVAAAKEFEKNTGKMEYLLDLEYKKLLPCGSLPNGGLAIKQIRQIPMSEQSPTVTTPFLVNQPMSYEAFQGEGTYVYAIHLLKSRWTLSTKNMWLTPENVAESIYDNITLEYAADGCIRTINAKMNQLPQSSSSLVGTTATDRWMMHHLSNPRTYALSTSNIKQVGASESPIVTLADLGGTMQGYIKTLNLSVDYAHAPWPEWNTTDTIGICTELSDYTFQQRSFTSGGITITTRFYYAVWESMILTYPLSHFVDTTITGLTTQPIVLHGYYSQTFRPGHHNFTDEFIFEPQLEPGISQTSLDELAARNVRLIYFYYAGSGSTISTKASWEQPFVVSDIDGDGYVNFADLAGLGQRWLDVGCDECGEADLNGDGRVDMEDLLTLAQQWLAGA